MSWQSWIKAIRPGTRSLRQTLAIYFLPISVIPLLVISIYAVQVFRRNTTEILVTRAASERDAILAELDRLETDLLEQARARGNEPALLAAVRSGNRKSVLSVLEAFRARGPIRAYTLSGKFLAASEPPGSTRVPYIPKEGIRDVRKKTETIGRFTAPDGNGLLYLVRTLIRPKDGKAVGILEEEHRFGQSALMEVKSRRQVDVVLLNEKLAVVAASFALPNEVVKSLSGLALRPEFHRPNTPTIVRLGQERYAAFLYPLPDKRARLGAWGFVGLFLSMTTLDTAVDSLTWAVIYLAVLFSLVAALLVFVLSNRLVRPIEALVAAMKRVKAGRVSQIPDLQSADEIEYLVRSFNDMARNISEAKKALELRLQELHRANQEIKQTQSTLIQSAKMASLGQIVAGVAHELNNPIGFIYSNMHHLIEYLGKIKELLGAYQELHDSLPEAERSAIEKRIQALDIEFILKDIDDLTKSCLDGAKRTKDIVLGLRLFSRMDEATFKPTDIHEGLRSTLKLLGTQVKDRITVHEEYGELPPVECNLSQLNQVFMNLLSNAAQAIEGKGDIWIRTYRDGDEAVIEIEDSGQGIAPEAVERIFDPFFTTKKVGEGTGLGLSIAYGLVQKHRGTITVKSKPGVGTRFTISLPLRQRVPAAG